MSRKKHNEDNTDMIPELFISFKENTEYMIPQKSKADYLNDLNAAGSVDEKIYYLRCIVEIYCLEAMKKGGKYSETVGKKMVSLLQKYGLQVGLSESVAHLLIHEGCYCEGVGDFHNALRFYEGSMPFEIKNLKLKYFRLNNLAFCLNIFKRFKEAEKYLREAVQMMPETYNSWKNLGVCLENQGQFEEAAECYLKAVEISKGEFRSVLHLQRLIIRVPILGKMQLLEEFVRSHNIHLMWETNYAIIGSYD